MLSLSKLTSDRHEGRHCEVRFKESSVIYPDLLESKTLAQHSDTEILAHLLNLPEAIDRQKLADLLLEHYGSIAKILQTSPKKIIKQFELPSESLFPLLISIELSKRCLKQKLKSPQKLSNSRLTRSFLEMEFKTLQEEALLGLFLDAQNALIHSQILFQGGLCRTFIHPRIILKTCLEHSAPSLIIAHNHPSGNHKPSTADINMTNELKKALEYIEVRLVDHIIVSEKGCFSFAEHAMI